MVEVIPLLISEAMGAGIHADYILFDSWFSSPKVIRSMKALGLDVVAMVKKSSKVHYRFQGEQLSCKDIFARCKHRRGCSRYLLSVPVELAGTDSDPDPIGARLVFVRNRSNRKDYLVLLTTDITLSEDEIIRLYGKRWDIEVFFKTCKSVLKLTGECRSLSYDAMCTQTAVVFLRYMGHPGGQGPALRRAAVLPGSRRAGGHFVCGCFREIATFSHKTAGGI